MNPSLSNNNKGTILFCPLDWGLGHASRLIPLIDKYRSDGYNVLLGGSGKSAELLKNTFGDIPFLSISSIPVSYIFKGKWFMLNIILQIPVFLYNTINEYFVLKKLVSRFAVSMVISDNRYGLHNINIQSTIITHQISPVLPRFMRIAEYPMYRLIKMLISRFDECWIPDFEGEQNLSGNLSHRYALPSNAKFIGPLSRFRKNITFPQGENFKTVIILSGPQPELGRITRKIIARIAGQNEKTIIICGLQDILKYNIKNPRITIVSHLEPGRFRSVIENASLVISTAGYSGIMDLFTIGCPALLIPVKGQTEQEYLCSFLQEQKLFMSVREDEMDFRNTALYKEKLSECRSIMAGFKHNLLTSSGRL